MSVLKALKCLLFDQMERESIQTILHSSCLPSSQELMRLAVADAALSLLSCAKECHPSLIKLWPLEQMSNLHFTFRAARC